MSVCTGTNLPRFTLHPHSTGSISNDLPAHSWTLWNWESKTEDVHTSNCWTKCPEPNFYLTSHHTRAASPVWATSALDDVISWNIDTCVRKCENTTVPGHRNNEAAHPVPHDTQNRPLQLLGIRYSSNWYTTEQLGCSPGQNHMNISPSCQVTPLVARQTMNQVQAYVHRILHLTRCQLATVPEGHDQPLPTSKNIEVRTPVNSDWHLSFKPSRQSYWTLYFSLSYLCNSATEQHRLDIRRYRNALYYFIIKGLWSLPMYWQRNFTGSRWSSFSSGVTWSYFRFFSTRRAALFCTLCRRAIWSAGRPDST